MAQTLTEAVTRTEGGRAGCSDQGRKPKQREGGKSIVTKDVTRTEGGRTGCSDQGRNLNRGWEGRVY